MASLVEQGMAAVRDSFGRHEGHRALHAKGSLCKGSFEATPAAAELTSAAHLQGDPVDVTVRFSNGAGNPHHPDFIPDGRGMATKFYLPDGSKTDIVALTLPCFFVRTPADFVAFTRAGKRLPVINQPGPAMLLYLARHREALPALRAFLASTPPAGYGHQRYNSIHSFKWVAADGSERFVRYSWLPQAGEASIAMAEAKQRGRDYLQEELAGALEQSPLRFDLEVQVAAPGDRVEDPTKAWPAERERVIAGTLELTGLELDREQGDDILVFDPSRLTAGIELSGDPLVEYRSQAYSISVHDRSGAARPAGL